MNEDRLAELLRTATKEESEPKTLDIVRALQGRLAVIGAPCSFKGLGLNVYYGAALGADAHERMSNEERKKECLAVLAEMERLRLDPDYEFALQGFDHAKEHCAIWMEN